MTIKLYHTPGLDKPWNLTIDYDEATAGYLYDTRGEALAFTATLVQEESDMEIKHPYWGQPIDPRRKFPWQNENPGKWGGKRPDKSPMQNPRGKGRP